MTARSLALAFAVVAVTAPAFAGSRTKDLADRLVAAMDAGRADDGNTADLFARVAKSWAYQPGTEVRDRIRLKAAVKAVRRLLAAPQAALSSREFERAQTLLEGVMGAEASKVMTRLQQELFRDMTLVFAAARAAGSDPVNKQPVTYRGKTYDWVQFNGRPILAERGATLPTPKPDVASPASVPASARAERGTGGALPGGAQRSSSGSPAGSSSAGHRHGGGSSSAQPHGGGASQSGSGGSSSSPLGPNQAEQTLNTALYSDVDQRNLAGLDPSFREKAVRILRRLQAKGWQPRVASGRRTLEEQKKVLAQGYSTTLKSWHLKGLAADIIDNRWGWGGPAADTNHPFWNDLGEAAAREGLTWGGNFKSFKDVAHVQDDGKNTPWPEVTEAPASTPVSTSPAAPAQPRRRVPTGYERAAAARNVERLAEERARRRRTSVPWSRIR